MGSLRKEEYDYASNALQGTNTEKYANSLRRDVEALLRRELDAAAAANRGNERRGGERVRAVPERPRTAGANGRRVPAAESKIAQRIREQRLDDPTAGAVPKFVNKQVVLTHWSKNDQLGETDPTFHGSNYVGKEFGQGGRAGGADFYIPVTLANVSLPSEEEQATLIPEPVQKRVMSHQEFVEGLPNFQGLTINGKYFPNVKTEEVAPDHWRPALFELI